MKGISHMVVGVATGMVLAELIGADPMKIVPLTTVGSLIPDIDKENSMINKAIVPFSTKQRNLIKTLLGIALIVVGLKGINSAMLQYLGVLVILSTISSKVEYRFSLFGGFSKREYHRTLFHDPIIGGIIFALPISILNIDIDYKIAFMAGVIFGHYLMDSFTTYGLPLYLFKKIIRMPIHYNSRNNIIETLIVAMYIAVITFIGYPQIMEYAVKLLS